MTIEDYFVTGIKLDRQKAKKAKLWHSYPEFGSHYRLDGDTLMFCPTLSSGEPELESEGEVEFDFVKSEDEKAYKRLLEIKEELKAHEKI